MMTATRLYTLIALAVLILPRGAAAQDFGYLSGSYGTAQYSNVGLDQFVFTFNDAYSSELDELMPAFGNGTGFGFETAYAYNVEGAALVIFSTELQNYKEENSGVFKDGTSRRLGLRIQDISSTSTLGIITGYGMIGPVFGTSRRSVRLNSSVEAGRANIAVSRDRGINGSYRSSNLLLEYGAHVIVGHGAFQLQAKLLKPFQRLYPSRLLLNDDIDSSSTSYFPSDYRAFAESDTVRRREGVRDAFTGWHLRVSVAIAFPA